MATSMFNMPLLDSVELDPARSEGDVIELLQRWMIAHDPETEFVRGVFPAKIDWENLSVLANMSEGWTNQFGADIIKLVGFVPVVEGVNGEKMDLLVYLLNRPGKPQEIRFTWVTDQDFQGAVRSTQGTQEVIDAFGRIDFELLRF